MMRIPILLVALAGCAALDRSGQEELAAELSGRVAGAAQACVSAMQNQSLAAADRRTLVLRTADTVWVNRLRSDCPGVTPMSTLVVETFAGRYCRGDRIRGVEPGSSIPGPTCVLGDFVPYRAPR